jgi:hypothetical protein
VRITAAWIYVPDTSISHDTFYNTDLENESILVADVHCDCVMLGQRRSIRSIDTGYKQ